MVRFNRRGLYKLPDDYFTIYLASGSATSFLEVSSVPQGVLERLIISVFLSSLALHSVFGDRYGPYLIVQQWLVFGTVCRLGLEVSLKITHRMETTRLTNSC